MPEDAYYDPHADWSLIPQHMHEGVRLYVMRGLPMGSFGSAIFANDFLGAAGAADEINLAYLSGWARFLFNYVPQACKGSPERAREWIADGGIVGRRVIAEIERLDRRDVS